VVVLAPYELIGFPTDESRFLREDFLVTGNTLLLGSCGCSGVAIAPSLVVVVLPPDEPIGFPIDVRSSFRDLLLESTFDIEVELDFPSTCSVFSSDLMEISEIAGFANCAGPVTACEAGARAFVLEKGEAVDASFALSLSWMMVSIFPAFLKSIFVGRD
jgi:hypothetical protein